MVIVMATVPTMYKDAQKAKEIINVFPPAMGRALSFNIDADKAAIKPESGP
jgi:hypothetical protein